MPKNIQTLPLSPEIVTALAPLRPTDGYKGTFGTLGIWAGSEGMLGSAYLSANSACRSGVGLVHMWLDEEFLSPMFLALPQIITHPLGLEDSATVAQLTPWMPRVSAWVVGPGLLPQDKRVRTGLLYLIEHAPLLLVDAGGLTVMAQETELFCQAMNQRYQKGLPMPVFTPHPGEFKRFFSEGQSLDVLISTDEERVSAARSFACQWKVVLVLKGHHTVVCTDKESCYINSTGNNGLAKAGSGDVLSGLIGSFLAQGLSPGQAALAGVYFHGLAGDLASQALGERYMQPTDLFAFFRTAFGQCGWESRI